MHLIVRSKCCVDHGDIDVLALSRTLTHDHRGKQTHQTVQTGIGIRHGEW